MVSAVSLTKHQEQKETFLFVNCLSLLGSIYIREKANVKSTSLLTCCIVSNVCIYTTATANIKEKNRFRVRFRSNINEP